VIVDFDVPLSSKTSFGIGGPAAMWFGAEPSALPSAVRFAMRLGGPIVVIGAGTNILVSDDTLLGIVIRVGMQSPPDVLLTKILPNSLVEVVASACTPWDSFVAHTVKYQWQGLECLSGIPGSVGAAPVQNIGAYGQQVSDVIIAVKAYDIQDGVWRTFTRGECEFGYRSSIFNRPENLDRFIITEVTMHLVRGGDPYRGHDEVRRSTGVCPTIHRVRDCVLRLRHRKGMIGEVRSAGSFFKNPTLPLIEFDRLFPWSETRSGANQWWRPVAAGARVSAAHLIEEAGFAKGYTRGKAGISPMHALALINLGGASAADVIALAREIQEGVAAKFSIVLEPEVRLVGFPEYPLLQR